MTAGTAGTARAALLALLCASCAESNASRGEENLVAVPMTRQEIMRYGTRRYAAPPAEVFRATVGALKAMGYEIASETPERGMIVTGRKFIRTVTTSFSFSFSSGGLAIQQTRQLIVRLFEDPATHEVVVSVLPKVFNGDVDLSEQPVWDLRSERTLWSQLFTQLTLLLAR